MKTSASTIFASFLLFGFAGWALENTLYKPRYSAAFKGRKVPFLPVYGVGGVAVALMSPTIVGFSILGRAFLYGGALTGVEYAACRVDRSLGRCSWDYDRGCATGDGKSGQGCIELKHSAAWAGLGLIAEQAVLRLP